MSKLLVPEKVTFYLKAVETDKYLNGQEFSCQPSYPSSDSDNLNARQWTRLDKPEIITVENKFNELQIINLDIRGEGGRAYQVLLRVNDKLLKVDLREDCLLDIITVLGICRNGVIDGTFCFCSVGSQFKLYRIGSDEYNKLLVTQSLVKVTKPVIGKMYQDKSGRHFIYFGTVMKQDVINDTPSNREYYYSQKVKYSLTPTKTKYQVWLSINEWNLRERVRNNDDSYTLVIHEKLPPSAGRIEFIKSRTCYEMIVFPEWTQSDVLKIADHEKFVQDNSAIHTRDYREWDKNVEEFLSKPVPVTDSESYYNYLAVSQMEWLA